MAKVKINGTEYEVPESFTFGEILDMEKVGGSLNSGGMSPLIAQVWITMRRRFPNTKFEDVLALDMSQVEFIEEGDELPPTNGADAPSKSQDSTKDSDSSGVPGSSTTTASTPVT